MNFSLEEEVFKATNLLAALLDHRDAEPDGAVPAQVLRQAAGLALLRVVKVGFGMTAKVGTGVVLARTDRAFESRRSAGAAGDGWRGGDKAVWSAPCAIGTAGVGVGVNYGADVTDIVLVLNTKAAVDAFASGKQVRLTSLQMFALAIRV